MRSYYVDTCGKLMDIFTEHCNLSLEEYEEIRSRLIDLVVEVQETDENGCGSFDEVERKASELGVIFEFLMKTNEITLTEYNALCNLVGKLRDDAKLMAEGET